jgi:hypothetical protein
MNKPRHRLRFWAMAATSVVCSLLGILLLVVGPDAETRRTGVMCLLFFGLGPAGYLGGPLLTRRGPGTVARDRVETSAGSEAAFVFPAPRAKRGAQLIGALGLAGGTALLYITAGGWVLAACVVVFGLFLLLAIYRMVRPVQVVLTPTRVVVGSVEAPWEAIDDVDLYEIPAGHTTVDMVGIDVLDRAELVQPRWMALIGSIGRRMSAYDVVVGADSFAGSGESVIDALRLYREDADRRRHIGGERELTQLREVLGESAARA